MAGGRWVRLGDFDFTAGQGSVVVNNQASGKRTLVVADAVMNLGAADYDGLQTAISYRGSQRLNASLSYTLSRATNTSERISQRLPRFTHCAEKRPPMTTGPAAVP